MKIPPIRPTIRKIKRLVIEKANQDDKMLKAIYNLRRENYQIQKHVNFIHRQLFDLEAMYRSKLEKEKKNK